jgi:hypothetical protein
VLIPGNRLDELAAYLRNNFLYAFVAATQSLLPIIAVLLMLAVARNRMSIAFDRIWVWAFSIAIIVVVTFHTQFGGPSQSIKLSVLAMVVYGLFKTTKSKISFTTFFKTLRDKCSLPVMISMMPFAYSAGTSNDLVAVAKAAMVFPLSLIFVTMLYLIQNDFKKMNAASVMTMIAFVATPATGLIKPWFNAAYVYRQPASLSEMRTPIELDGGVIKIDVATAAGVQELREMLAAVNIPDEAEMIDFTGRMPGLVLLSRGKPLGLAWILAGYPGSKAAADLVIKDISKAELERAVFLTAAANEQSDSLDWKALLHGVIDWESTHKFAGAINFPNYMNSANRAIEVWVPVRLGFPVR